MHHETQSHAHSPCTQVPFMEFPVQLTKQAVCMAKEAFKENPEEGSILRISIRGGGCAGFQYGLHFVQEENVDTTDWMTHVDGLCVVTDAFTANQLQGTTIDYAETLEGAGFQFVNPNAKRTCGCGSSFSE